MRKFKLTTIIVSFIILAACFCSCFSRLDSGVEGDPELTLGNLPDYSGAHASDAPYIVFSSDLEPISAERIEEVRQIFYRMIYKSEREAQTEYLKKTEAAAEDLDRVAENIAAELAMRYKSALMNSEHLEYSDSLSYAARFLARYYGTVGGCEIISINSFTEKKSSIELGGVTIENSNPFYLFVCRGEEMIPLAEAYDAEWLTPIDILLISKRNTDFNAYWNANYANRPTEYNYVEFVDDLEELSDSMIAEIIERMYADTYAERYSLELAVNTERYTGIYSEANIDCVSSYFAAIEAGGVYDIFACNRYYGIVSGYAVFAEVDPTDVVTTINLAGHQIVFGNGAKMWVYSTDSGVVEFKEAYERGLLTDADIAKIADRHEAYESYVFK